MKYRNKVTGNEIEALHIYTGMYGRDILEFAGGLVDTLTDNTFRGGFVTISGWDFKFIITMGDYLMKVENKLYILPEKEFENCYEKVKEGEQMKFITRKIYYTVSFENDNVPYREGIYYSTISASQEIPECKFLSLFYNDLKEEISKAQYQELKNLKQLDINKIEIVTDKHECHIKKCGVVETELPEKNILDPVENATTSIEVEKERTVRDCVLDMLIEQNAEKIKSGFVLYLQNILSSISKWGNTGDANEKELENYAKLSDNLSSIKNLTATRLLDYTEKEILNLLGIASHITLKNFMLINIEKILKESENNGK